MEFYGRGVKLVKDPRAREVFRKLATEEVHHLKPLENRYQELLKQDPQLESRPTFLFFKGAANGLFSTGTEQLRRDGVDDLEAYRIGIRCERGSHRFFKRYGERFEDSEGKLVFLEFAEEEREHLELLKKRSEEHTSELQSQSNLVCRLLLEKKKKKNIKTNLQN